MSIVQSETVALRVSLVQDNIHNSGYEIGEQSRKLYYKYTL